MSTMQVTPSSATPARSPLSGIRQARRWARETPAPEWEGGARDRARFLGYVGVSMLVWTAVGMLSAMGISGATDALVALVG